MISRSFNSNKVILPSKPFPILRLVDQYQPKYLSLKEIGASLQEIRFGELYSYSYGESVPFFLKQFAQCKVYEKERYLEQDRFPYDRFDLVSKDLYRNGLCIRSIRIRIRSEKGVYNLKRITEQFSNLGKLEIYTQYGGTDSEDPGFYIFNRLKNIEEFAVKQDTTQYQFINSSTVIHHQIPKDHFSKLKTIRFMNIPGKFILSLIEKAKKTLRVVDLEYSGFFHFENQIGDLTFQNLINSIFSRTHNFTFSSLRVSFSKFFVTSELGKYLDIEYLFNEERSNWSSSILIGREKKKNHPFIKYILKILKNNVFQKMYPKLKTRFLDVLNSGIRFYEDDFESDLKVFMESVDISKNKRDGTIRNVWIEKE